MALDEIHPTYGEAADIWLQLRHTWEGEREVKRWGTRYLPMTSAMLDKGGQGTSRDALGWKMYDAYKLRARMPDVVAETVELLLGVMHSKPATFVLPPQMEYLLERATTEGETLEQLLQHISFNQLLTGRLGLLGDVIDQGSRDGEFYISTWAAESIKDWDVGQSELDVESLNYVLLDESGDERNPDTMAWEQVEKYLLLSLGELAVADAAGEATYSFAKFKAEDYGSVTEAAGLLKSPTHKGREAKEIPFVIVNATDTKAAIGRAPLLGLSNLALTIYRGEADFRQTLFMMGQDTLVVVGGDPEETYQLGAGASIVLGPNGDAKFIGVSGDGLNEQAKALMNDYAEANAFARKLMDSVTRERESGEALRIRVATRTASLNRVVDAAAAGLEELLKKLARWAGYDDSVIEVKPNKDFVDDSMTGLQILELVNARKAGAPITLATIHKIMQDRNVTELPFEEELKLALADEATLEALTIVETPQAPPQVGDAGDEDSDD